jgi:hypothetical protein
MKTEPVRIRLEIKLIPSDGLATVDEITDALIQAIEGIGTFDVDVADSLSDDGTEVWEVDEANQIDP